MHELISGFLSNDSSFGRLMTRIGIVIGANLLFVFFSFPVVTAGAAYAALYHVMLKTLRGDGNLNPFRTFWNGFRSNFKQATAVWLAALAFLILAAVDIRVCGQAGGFVAWFRYPIYALCIAGAVLLLYIFPVMAAFAASIPNLLRTSLFFALKKPWKTVVVLFFNLFPLFLTYTDSQMLPLYAFLWFFFGFGAIALLGATLLLPEFKPYLSQVDEYGGFLLDENGNRIPEGQDVLSAAASLDRTEKELLDEMKKLGM